MFVPMSQLVASAQDDKVVQVQKDTRVLCLQGKIPPLWLGGLVTPPFNLDFFGWFLHLAEIVLNSKVLPSPVLEIPPSLLMPVDGRCTHCFQSAEPSLTASAEVGQPMPTLFTRVSRRLMEETTGYAC